jgi:hypothetical protein
VHLLLLLKLHLLLVVHLRLLLLELYHHSAHLLSLLGG